MTNSAGVRARGTSQKPLGKLVVGGVITVGFEAFCGGHYLEFLKIAKQCSKPGVTYGTITRGIIGTKGLVGVLDGFVPWGALQSLFKGASFAWGHAFATNCLPDTDVLTEGQKAILSGGIGGAVQGIVMNPVLLLKTRVMTDPSFRSAGTPIEQAKPRPRQIEVAGSGCANVGMRTQGPAKLVSSSKGGSLMHTARMSSQLGWVIIRREGLGALMKGCSVFTFKRFCDWTTRFAFVVWLENMQKARLGLEQDAKLPFLLASMCALGGGTLSSCATLPIDVAVARIQDAKKAGRPVTLKDIFLEAKGNWRLVTRGFLPRVAHVASTTLLMKNLVNIVYDSIYT